VTCSILDSKVFAAAQVGRTFPPSSWSLQRKTPRQNIIVTSPSVGDYPITILKIGPEDCQHSHQIHCQCHFCFRSCVKLRSSRLFWQNALLQSLVGSTAINHRNFAVPYSIHGAPLRTLGRIGKGDATNRESSRWAALCQRNFSRNSPLASRCSWLFSERIRFYN